MEGLAAALDRSPGKQPHTHPRTCTADAVTLVGRRMRSRLRRSSSPVSPASHSDQSRGVPSIRRNVAAAVAVFPDCCREISCMGCVASFAMPSYLHVLYSSPFQHIAKLLALRSIKGSLA
jgi:hypothetical protein